MKKIQCPMCDGQMRYLGVVPAWLCQCGFKLYTSKEKQKIDEKDKQIRQLRSILKRLGVQVDNELKKSDIVVVEINKED